MTMGLALSAEVRPGVDAMGGTPCSERTAVALLNMKNGRLRVLLDAYLNGPGRRHFERREPAASQVLLADADSASARAALQLWLKEHRQPAVAISVRDPLIVGTVWLPHPFSFDALLRAVTAARAVRVDEAALGSPRQSAMAAVAPVGAPSAKVRAARTVSALRPAPPSRVPFGRRAEGDWTGAAVWAALGLLAIVWLATLLGWRPAADPAPARETPSPARTAALSADLSPDAALAQAVADSLRDYRGHSPRELEDIRSQLRAVQAERRLAATQSERRDALDQLTRPGATQGQLRFDPHRMPIALMPSAQPVDERSESWRRSLDLAVARALTNASGSYSP